MKPSINKELPETYLADNIENLQLIPFEWRVMPPSMARYEVLMVAELSDTSSISNFEQALSNLPLRYMIEGALKTITAKTITKLIVVDIPSPNVLPGVSLYVSESGNWHFNVEEPFTPERLEIANKLGYVYFQDNIYFIALRHTNEFVLAFVYRKK